MAEGFIKVNRVNELISSAYTNAGTKVSQNNLVNARQILAGVIQQSGAGAEFDALVESGAASAQTSNLMRSAERKAVITRVAQSGDGTLTGNAKAQRTASAMTATDSANAAFAESINQAGTPLLQKLNKVAGFNPKLSADNQRTNDGYEYTTLSSTALSLLPAEEAQSYRQKVAAAYQTRTAAFSASKYQTTVSAGQTRLQGLEQKINLNLAQTPRTELEKVQYQLREWQAFLKREPSPEAKLTANNNILALQGRQATAERDWRVLQQTQSITNKNASNAALSSADHRGSERPLGLR